MRSILILLGVFLLGGVIWFGFDDESPVPKRAGKAGVQLAAKAGAKAANKSRTKAHS